MAISYEWNCKQVDYYPTLDDKTKVIYNVHWRLKGTSDSVDGEGNPYSAEVYGSQSLDTSDLSSFTEYADLTAADVENWVKLAIGSEEIENLENNISSQIDELQSPSSVSETMSFE